MHQGEWGPLSTERQTQFNPINGHNKNAAVDEMEVLV